MSAFEADDLTAPNPRGWWLLAVRAEPAPGIAWAAGASWQPVASGEPGGGPRWLGHPTATAVTADGPYGAALFDGELHDRAALRAWLGPEVTPDANDAALVLATVRREGPAALVQRLRGVFAAIVWDRASDTAWAARDPIGLHPLFAARCGRGVLFAPSIDALLAHPSVSRAINRAAVAEHLCHRWAATDETYFLAVARIPAGHVVAHAPDGSQDARRHWSPAPASDDDWLPEDDDGAFDALLSQAVERAVGDVQAGIFLSGGFDSVSIAAVAIDLAEQAGRPRPLALSLAFPEPECNEEPVQRQVAAQLGLEQTMLPFFAALGGRGLMATAFEVSASWPVPLQNPWRPAYMALGLEGRRRGCDVVLTGNGGDDWLTVGGDFLADLLARGDLHGVGRYARAILRGYSQPRLALMRYLFWTHGIRPLAVWRGRQAVGRVAPGMVRRWRRAELRGNDPSWLAPDAALRRELDARLEARLDARERELEPGGRYPLYVRAGRHYLNHPLTAMDHDEDFEAGRRLGLPRGLAHPYWDADLVMHLDRTSPWTLLQGGRDKGLVRETVHRRFPGVGFLGHRKVTATGFFSGVVGAEGPGVLGRLGGLRALADLGVVDRHILDAQVAADVACGRLAESSRAWEVLNLETWLRARSQ